MKKIFVRTLFVLIGLFLLAQFYRPERNISDVPSPNDITKKYKVPADVMTILKNSCFDCHSNNTRYPWYNNIQPAAWWMNSHVQTGKRNLNFSEFAAYPARRQVIKLKQIGEQIDQQEMPLPSYLIIHTDAKLSQEQRDRLMAWTQALTDTIKSIYPKDSLKAPPKRQGREGT